MKSSGQKRMHLFVAFLVAMTVCNLSLPVQMIGALRNGYQDFTIFYTGASLLRHGQSSLLYDLGAQYQVEREFTNVPIRQGPLPFNHPPFEALFFVPFTFLSYWPAYLLWTAINLLMLVATVVLLRTNVAQFTTVSPLFLGLGAAGFLPITIGIVQGQDIIVLLLLFVLAIVRLEKREDAIAGALLGAGIFRPQLVLPLVALLAIRRWRMLVGFVPVALLLAGLSAALVGVKGLVDYVRFIFRLEATGARAFGLEALPNLRGLLSQFPGLTAAGVWSRLLIFVSSAIVFWMAARRIRNANDPMIFTAGLAAVTAILLSFHALVYDLTLLFPILSLLFLGRVRVEDGKPDRLTIVLLAMFFLTPLYAYLGTSLNRFFLFTLLELWLFVRLAGTSPLAGERA